MRICDWDSDVVSPDLRDAVLRVGALDARWVEGGNPGVLRARQPHRAQFTAAPRWWEKGYKSRIGVFGMLGDEMMSGILADESLEPGEGQIRALITHGSNLANIMPDQKKIVRALRSLDLLVNIEPYINDTR